MASAQRRFAVGIFLARLGLAALLALLVVVLLAGSVLLSYGSRHAGRIYRGVRIGGLDVGGLTRQEAVALAEQRLNDEALPYLALTAGDERWTLCLADLGGAYDAEEAAWQAWSLGRSGVFREDLLTRARLLVQGVDIAPTLTLDEGQLLVALRAVARQAAHPARRARLQLTGLSLQVGDRQTGREVDVFATRAAIADAVADAVARTTVAPREDAAWSDETAWDRLLSQEERPLASALEPIVVPLVFQDVVPQLAAVEGAQEQLQTLLAAPLTLRAAVTEMAADGSFRPVTRSWTLDPALLASWARVEEEQAYGGTAVEVALNEARIGALVADLARQINRPPREGRFGYDSATNALSVMAPPQPGQALDTAVAQRLIADACFGAQRVVDLPVTPLAPRVTQADLEALMPLQLVSEGESSFAGSTAERLTNIRVATAHFQGVVIPPHATFSFLEHLGLVTVAGGYTEAWVIYGDRTVLGAGGGVCQVSTTAFRAAFWGGFPIIERSPHAYRVTTYEPPLGLDAAVFSPGTDMKFENDTDTPLLMLTEVDEGNGKLYFRLYGRPTGRQVTLEGPTTSNPTTPGPPVYDEDPSLAPGQQVLEERARDGLDVTLYRVVAQDGEVLRRDQIYSRYQAWPARYRVGP